MKNIMPEVNIEKVISVNGLTGDEAEILRRIVNKGALRASKPKIDYTISGRNREPSYITGCAAYVWRNVAFYISPIGQHQCVPVMAFCDLPMEDYNERRKVETRMNALVDMVTSSVPARQWHGVARWAAVLG